MSGKFVLMHTPVEYVKGDIVIDVRGQPNRYKTAIGHLIGYQLAGLVDAKVSLHDPEGQAYQMTDKEIGHMRNYFSSKTAPEIRIITTHTSLHAETLFDQKVIELRELARAQGIALSIRSEEPENHFDEYYPGNAMCGELKFTKKDV